MPRRSPLNLLRRAIPRPSTLFPVLDWGRRYDRATFSADLTAAVIVTIMLIPQSLAYALLAGLPPELGLYASILPLLAYALLGTSRTMAVGPVALTSLMTAAAVGRVAGDGTAAQIEAAVILAALSGLLTLAMGVTRLGFLASFLSHPVIAGFNMASAVLIAGSQLRHLLGVAGGGDTLWRQLGSLGRQIDGVRPDALAIGLGTMGFLFWARRGAAPLLMRAGVPAGLAATMARAAPIVAVAATTMTSYLLRLDLRGLAVVGEVPARLPSLGLPSANWGLWRDLLWPALAISVTGYVSSISVAQTLAARRRERIDPDQELVALGGVNLASAVSGGFPVTGGFARSIVNFDAGARSPAAGALTAVGMALATLTLTGALRYLPQATLAATIIVPVLSLIDPALLRRIWRYSVTDGLAMLVTLIATLTGGVETGIGLGVALSLALHLYRSSRPHVAVLGQVPGTHHFRNVARHRVIQVPDVLVLRIDESLYFPNARFLEDTIYDRVAADPAIRHVVLNCPAVNVIDASALDALGAVNDQLWQSGVRLHLSEVKGPVMDRLERSDFLSRLSGQVFLSQIDAMRALAPLATARAEIMSRPDASCAVTAGGARAAPR